MKVLHRLQTGAISLACLGLLIPTMALEGAEPDRPQPVDRPTTNVAIQDIALAPGGVFRGQVVDALGQGKPGLPVTLRHEEAEIAATNTDIDGRFVVSGLRGGVVQVVAGDNSSLYRLWAPNTAPPAAGAGALIIDQGIVRGQSPIGSLLTNPLFILGIAATAIAIPIAIHQFREKKSGS